MFKWLEKFLEKIAKANKANFGDQRLDCCDLNKPNQQPSDSHKEHKHAG